MIDDLSVAEGAMVKALSSSGPWGEAPEVVPLAALSEIRATTFAFGARGVSLEVEAERLSDRAWVTRVRLTRSAVFALTGVDVSPDGEPRELLVLVPKRDGHRAKALPPPLTSDRFSLDDYRALLVRARELGYRFVDFDAAFAAEGRSVLLRHDVDLSPRWAVAMARVEAALGVRATYFFMISGAFYDLLEQRESVRAIAALGHDIGFHYDTGDGLDEGLDVLSAIVGRRLHLVAQHNPTLAPERRAPPADVVDAYDPRLMQRFSYVSDSGMRHRRDSFASLIDEGRERIYALCHPEAWLSDGGDLVSMIRLVEQEELSRRRRRFDEFVEGNIRYLSGWRG